jgi:hypothetical protein
MAPRARWRRWKGSAYIVRRGRHCRRDAVANGTLVPLACGVVDRGSGIGRGRADRNRACECVVGKRRSLRWCGGRSVGPAHVPTASCLPQAAAPPSGLILACPSVPDCSPKAPPGCGPLASAPCRATGMLDRFSRSSRWCGGQAMTAHDFADHFDVRRASASKDGSDIPEVARAQQTRTDDC